MQGHKQFSDKVVLRFRLSERVPKQNLYRRLAELLDWSFLYQQTQALYSHTGQPSLDPVVFFKLVLVGRLENLISDRRLVEHCALRLDILYFLGYEVDEDLPWHSTISRTRQLYPVAVFEHLFDQVFAQCLAAGLVVGETHALDSAPIKANASLDSLRPKQLAPTLTVMGKTDPSTSLPPLSPPTPAHELRRVATRQAKQQQGGGGLGAHHAKAQLLSNKTHQSLSDPEARISVKPGKVRALNYRCSLAVDTASGLISHVQADLADSRDSVHLPRLVAQLQTRLTAQQLPLREVLADTGYSNGFNYAFLEQRGITPWIPIFGKYKPVIEGFTYEPDRNAYRCPAGKLLPFRNYCTSLAGNWLQNYRAEYRDCQACPLKPTCVPSATQKKLVRSPYGAAYLRAWQRQRRVRQGTVEPVFGNLLHHYGLRRVNTKGQAAAQKAMLLSAVAYNLQKLLKYQPTRGRRMALACQPGLQQRAQGAFSGYLPAG
jgi:transposase